MPKLTKAFVDRQEAPAKGYVCIWDSELEGFGLRIQSGGRKTYIIRYRTKTAERTQRKMSLCRTSDMPPEKARELARSKFAEVAMGMDPAGDLKPKVVEPTPESEPVDPSLPKPGSVAHMFACYVAHMRAQGKTSAINVERALLTSKKSAVSAFGRDKPAGDVTSRDVVDHVAEFFRDGHRGAADKQRGYIASAYNWAIRSANDYTAAVRVDWGLTRNPAADVARDAGAVGTRDRNLDAAELRLLWKACDPAAGVFSQKTAICLRMLICCGQRVQETLRIDGADIDLAKGLWNMPAHKTKGRKRAHTIPLPAQAIEPLRELILQYGEGPLFMNGQGELMDFRLVGRAVTRWLDSDSCKLAHFQVRDIRRTWKSRGHDAGIDRFTRDLIQQHAKQDTGSKNYDRAEYLPQMTEAMQKWSAWLSANIEPKPLAAWPDKLAA